MYINLSKLATYKRRGISSFKIPFYKKNLHTTTAAPILEKITENATTNKMMCP